MLGILRFVGHFAYGFVMCGVAETEERHITLNPIHIVFRTKRDGFCVLL